jgi:hypothetical protein
MVRWLVRSAEPVIVVDWCRLKADGRWHLLRAAVPVGGRTLTLFEVIVAERHLASPAVERRFLERLRTLLPEASCPILVTDAGFRAPWCRSVERLGWRWLTRVRHRTHAKPAEIEDTPEQWVACRALYQFAGRVTRDLGLFDLVRTHPIQARLILHMRSARGRHHMTRTGRPVQGKASRQIARRETEPWLLAVSPTMGLTAMEIVSLYRRRMQIELGFRDLKSHRYGQAFEDSLTRKRERIEILLMLHALAVFAAWLAGMAAEAEQYQDKLNPYPARRRLYSVVRIGWEALARDWLPRSAQVLLDSLHRLSLEATDNMAVQR